MTSSGRGTPATIVEPSEAAAWRRRDQGRYVRFWAMIVNCAACAAVVQLQHELLEPEYDWFGAVQGVCRDRCSSLHIDQRIPELGRVHMGGPSKPVAAGLNNPPPGPALCRSPSILFICLPLQKACH